MSGSGRQVATGIYVIKRRTWSQRLGKVPVIGVHRSRCDWTPLTDGSQPDARVWLSDLEAERSGSSVPLILLTT